LRPSDAQLNRARILQVATETLSLFGANPGRRVSQTGKSGNGTLYRPFPTRDALIEVAYRIELEKLAGAVRKFSEAMSPIEELRAWMLLFVDHIATKHPLPLR